MVPCSSAAAGGGFGGESLDWIKATLSICLHQPSCQRFWSRAEKKLGRERFVLSMTDRAGLGDGIDHWRGEW